MLHARFSKLNLETDMEKRCFHSSEEFSRKDKMEIEFEEQEREGSKYEYDFIMPQLLAKSNSSPKTRTPRKLRGVTSPLKENYPRPPPAPRSSMNSDSQYSSLTPRSKDDPAIFVKHLSEKLEMLKEHGHKERKFSSPAPTLTGIQTEGQSTRMSVELRKLCSGSSLSAFDSDSENSSCLFANKSYMSSTDFTDDVFPEPKQASPVKSPSKSDFLHDSLCQDVSIEFAEKKQPDVIKGAAIIGSPSKLRHQSSRGVRRIKSASALALSCRYAPYTSSPRKSPQPCSPSGRRWYKAKTDPYLCNYEDRKRAQRDFENEIILPKRALCFDDHDSQSCKAQVEKFQSPHLPQVARTDTPESGYGSFNTTQQTPEIAQNLTPVSSLKKLQVQGSNSPFAVADGTPRAPPCRINSGPVPWLEKFDVLSRLYKMEPSLVDRILSYLKPGELVMFASVSIQWREICLSLPTHASLRDGFLKEQRQQFLRKKENLPSSSRVGRQTMTRPGTPLAAVQRLGKPTAESTPLRHTSSIHRFQEVGQKLGQGQCLDKCKCGSPARVEVISRRAQCSSVHCQLEFCIKCRMGYHGSSPCSPFTGRGRPRGPSVGSRKSKRNLRRHSRLSSTDS